MSGKSSIFAVAMLAATASAQATVMFKPMLVYSGRQVWTVSIKGGADHAQTFSREAVMQLAPEIHELPTGLDQDVLDAAAMRKPSSLLVKLWMLFSNPAAAALNATAIAQRTNGPLYVAAGIEGVNLIASIANSGPKPSRYFSQILPEVVMIPAAPGGVTYGVVEETRAAVRQSIGPLQLDAAGDPAHALAVILRMKDLVLRGAETP